MAQQLFAVTGNPQFKKRRYTDEINARLGLLPQMMEQQGTQKYQSAQIENMKRSQEIEEARLGIDKERLKQGEAELGIRQGQFGLEEKQFGLSEKSFGLDEQRYALDQKRYGQQEQQNQWARKSAEKQQDLRERSEMLGMGVQAFGLGSNILGANWWKNSSPQIRTDPKMSAASGSTVPMQSGPQPFFSDFSLGATLGGGALGFAGSRLGGKNKLLKVGLGAGIGAAGGYFGGGNSFSNAFGGGLLGGLAGLL